MTAQTRKQRLGLCLASTPRDNRRKQESLEKKRLLSVRTKWISDSSVSKHYVSNHSQMSLATELMGDTLHTL